MSEKISFEPAHVIEEILLNHGGLYTLHASYDAISRLMSDVESCSINHYGIAYLLELLNEKLLESIEEMDDALMLTPPAALAQALNSDESRSENAEVRHD